VANTKIHVGRRGTGLWKGPITTTPLPASTSSTTQFERYRPLIIFTLKTRQQIRHAASENGIPYPFNKGNRNLFALLGLHASFDGCSFNLLISTFRRLPAVDGEVRQRAPNTASPNFHCTGHTNCGVVADLHKTFHSRVELWWNTRGEVKDVKLTGCQYKRVKLFGMPYPSSYPIFKCRSTQVIFVADISTLRI